MQRGTSDWRIPSDPVSHRPAVSAQVILYQPTYIAALIEDPPALAIIDSCELLFSRLFRYFSRSQVSRESLPNAEEDTTTCIRRRPKGRRIRCFDGSGMCCGISP